jgi:hypothetical protein
MGNSFPFVVRTFISDSSFAAQEVPQEPARRAQYCVSGFSMNPTGSYSVAHSSAKRLPSTCAQRHARSS